MLSLSVIVLLAAGCGQTQPQTNSQASSLFPSGQTQTRQNAGGPDYFPNGQRPEDPININYQQIVNGKLDSSQVTVGQGMYALALLKMTHKVETKDYGGMGEFVESIDGIRPDGKHFWEFFVNGKSSNVGASSYILKNGDKIEWELSVIK